MRFWAAIVFIVAVGLANGGCSVYMAFTQPPQIDVEEFRAEGPSRDQVLATLGVPTSSRRNLDGSREDIYEFYEGSDSAWKIVRGFFHLLADLITFAVWEIVATPMEYGIRGDKITGQADFDTNDRLISFRILGRETAPLEKIHRQQNGSS